MTDRIFLSYSYDVSSKNAADVFLRVAEKEKLKVITGKAPGVESPSRLVRSRIFSCDYFAAILSAQGEDKGAKAKNASAWVYNEIGIAYALDFPLVICKEQSVEDLGLASLTTSFLTFNAQDLDQFEAQLHVYLTAIRERGANRSPSLGQFVNGLATKALEGHRPQHDGKTFQKAKELLEDIVGDDPHDVLRIYTSSEILRGVLFQLNRFEALEPKLAIGVEKKKAVADAFLDIHGDDVKDVFKEVFIESGSTLAAVAQSLSSKLPKETDRKGAVRPRIQTNNAIAYLFLWLCKRVMCKPVPDGPPDKKYAGMFGPLTGRNRKPNYVDALKFTDPEGEALARDLSNMIFSSSVPSRDECLVLGAYSGLQVSDKINAIQVRGSDEDSDEPCTDEIILQQLKENCRGFHVGSYENHLFKRCLYMTGAPTIVFLHDDKIDCPIEVEKCHFLFVSPDKSEWLTAMKDYPLSVWVGCEKATYRDVQSRLKEGMAEGNWEFAIYGEGGQFPVVIGHNEKFRNAFKKLEATPYSRKIR